MRIRPRIAAAALAALAAALVPPASGAAVHTCDGREATIVGTPGDDQIQGTLGDDVIVGLGGVDYIEAGPGDDAVCLGEDFGRVWGELGNDTLLAGIGGGNAEGGPGNDVIVGFGPAPGAYDGETTDGGDGDDILRPGSVGWVVDYAGGAGNDVLEGTDHIFDDGTDYKDIDDYFNRDKLRGGEGDDVLDGGAGPDLLYPGTGNDLVEGGEGRDLVSYSESGLPVSVDLPGGLANIPAVGASVFHHELRNLENVHGTPFPDHIVGDDSANHLDGCGGSDVISGNGGDDWIDGISGVLDSDGHGQTSTSFTPCDPDLAAAGFGLGFTTEIAGGAPGAMTIDGGDGVDFCRAPNFRTNCEQGDDLAAYSCNGLSATIVGTPGEDRITGTLGDDVIVGLDGSDRIDAGAGDDTVCSGQDGAWVKGGDGNDTLLAHDWGYGFAEGGAGDDLIIGFGGAVGGAGDDILDPGSIGTTVGYSGGDGNDVLHGTDYWFDDYERRDELEGGDGDDVLLGGSGPDVLLPGIGNDYVDGGEGRDQLSYVDSTLPVSVDLSSGRAGLPGGDDSIFQGEVHGIEDVRGSVFRDHITGNDAPNVLSGCGGSDVITALAGDDYVYGLTGMFDDDGGVNVSNDLDECGSSPPTFIHSWAADAPGQMTIDGGDGFDFCRGPNWRANCEAGEGL